MYNEHADYIITKSGLTKNQAINALNKGEWVRQEDMPDFMAIRKHDNDAYDYENDQFVFINEFWEYWGQEQYKNGWMTIKFIDEIL